MEKEEIILEKYFGENQLEVAFKRVLMSSGRDIKDRFGIAIYKESLQKNLKELSTSLKNKKFKPSRPFKYYQPKSYGTQRTKSVLFIEDAIIYQAIANEVAYEIFDELSERNSYVYGSVLHDEVKDGVSVLEKENAVFHFFKYYVPLFNEFTKSVNSEVSHGNINYKLETDITGFFDSIPHSKLLITLLRLGMPEIILNILEDCLNTWSGTRESITPGVGIPQGPAASYFFANVLLSDLDKIMIQKGYTYYRYMDDIRVYEEEELHTYKALIQIDKYLKGLALSLNSKKTNVTRISKDRKSEVKKLLSVTKLYSEDELTDKIAVTDDKNIVTQEILQEDLDNNVITPEEALPFYIKELEKLENKIIELYNKVELIMVINGDLAAVQEMSDDIRDISFDWRQLVRVIKSIGDIDFKNEVKMAWMSFIKHLFWNANYFSWNLSQYKLTSSDIDKLDKIRDELSDYEWVGYQILSCISNSENIEYSRLRRYYRIVSQENSQFLRLGFYQLLLKHTERSKQLYSTIKDSIRREKSPYIKRALSYEIERIDMNESEAVIKYWFGI